LASPHVANVTRRIVRMFELYSEKIDPEDENFMHFVSDFLAKNSPQTPETLPYSELYLLIQKAIREFLKE
jgi:hypothetical protein